jgi:hypothetical protein
VVWLGQNHYGAVIAGEGRVQAHPAGAKYKLDAGPFAAHACGQLRPVHARVDPYLGQDDVDVACAQVVEGLRCRGDGDCSVPIML